MKKLTYEEKCNEVKAKLVAGGFKNVSVGTTSDYDEDDNGLDATIVFINTDLGNLQIYYTGYINCCGAGILYNFPYDTDNFLARVLVTEEQKELLLDCLVDFTVHIANYSMLSGITVDREQRRSSKALGKFGFTPINNFKNKNTDRYLTLHLFNPV